MRWVAGNRIENKREQTVDFIDPGFIFLAFKCQSYLPGFNSLRLGPGNALLAPCNRL